MLINISGRRSTAWPRDYSYASQAQDLAKEKLTRTFLVHSVVAGLWATLCVFNPFVPNAPFLYKTCFQGVEKGCIENEWVKKMFSTWLHQLLVLSIHIFGICHNLLISMGLFKHLSYPLLCQRKYPTRQVCHLLLRWLWMIVFSDKTWSVEYMQYLKACQSTMSDIFVQKSYFASRIIHFDA